MMAGQGACAASGRSPGMGRSFVQAGGGGGGETRGSEAWFCLVRLRHWGAIAESREEVWRKEKVALLSVQDQGAVTG